MTRDERIALGERLEKALARHLRAVANQADDGEARLERHLARADLELVEPLAQAAARREGEKVN